MLFYQISSLSMDYSNYSMSHNFKQLNLSLSRGQARGYHFLFTCEFAFQDLNSSYLPPILSNCLSCQLSWVITGHLNLAFRCDLVMIDYITTQIVAIHMALEQYFIHAKRTKTYPFGGAIELVTWFCFSWFFFPLTPSNFGVSL